MISTRFLQALFNSEIEEITHKIEALDAIRAKLEKDIMKLQEDELELDDERKTRFRLYLIPRTNANYDDVYTNSGRSTRTD